MTCLTTKQMSIAQIAYYRTVVILNNLIFNKYTSIYAYLVSFITNGVRATANFRTTSSSMG